jgi:hypothetical protein
MLINENDFKKQFAAIIFKSPSGGFRGRYWGFLNFKLKGKNRDRLLNF